MMPATPIGPSLIGDEQHIRPVPSTVLAVQQRDRFAGRAEAHVNVPTELAEVVGMHRLPELEHHVVGDINNRTDRAHAGTAQALAHPPGRCRSSVDRCTTHPANVGQAAAASRYTATRSRPARSLRACVCPAGGPTGTCATECTLVPASAATSRAMPRTDIASPRFARDGEIQTPDHPAPGTRATADLRAHRPATRGCRKRSRQGRAPWPKPACPSDSTPRSFAALMSSSPGSRAPTIASALFSPARALRRHTRSAPAQPAPKATRQTCNLSACG